MLKFKKLRKLISFLRKPYLLELYNWNNSKTQAYCSADQFDKVFVNCNVVKDLDNKGRTFAIFYIGHEPVTVIRDDEKSV